MLLPRPALLLMVVLTTAVLFACFMAGCGTGQSEKGPSTGTIGVSNVKKADGVQVTLMSEPDVVKNGEKFSLTLNVHNLSKDSRTFTLPSTQEYEFIASNTDGNEVWRGSHGMMYAQMITPMKMAAGGSRLFEAVWDPSGLPTGKYMIQGYFLGMKNLKPSVAVEITR